MTPDKIDLLKKTIAKNASQAELDTFIEVCDRLRLDPFSRQIFLVQRRDQGVTVMQPQVSIDGFRLVAERSGQYAGQTPPQWCGPDGVWRDLWLEDKPPSAAKCGVYRHGFSEPLTRVARYLSYVQMTRDRDSGQMRPNKMWTTMPEVMLSKCAEMLALRAAFPNELSGVYGVEEMGQSSNETDKPERSRHAKKKTLDDVSAHGVVRYDSVTGEVASDEYGMPIPIHKCPVIRPGRPNEGKAWSELDEQTLLDMYEHADEMTSEQREWCEYLLVRHGAAKQRPSP